MISSRQGMAQTAQASPGSGDTELLTQILAELVQMRLRDEQGRNKEPGIDFAALFERVTTFLEEKMAVISRRIDGDYEVDKWGRDLELVTEMEPLFRFMYEKYWRVTTTGLENVPADGSALLVANHSGVLPWDGAMVITAVASEHPQPRLIRALHLTRATEMPIVGLGLSRLGQVQALPENAERLLNEGELVLVFPEGVKGVGKPFSERYQLARFGRGGFVRVAIRAGVPIIPVSIVGAEEIYPNLANMKMLASMFNLPYLPATPTFPWLGPLGVIPLPTKWTIRFHKPIQVTDIKHRPAEEPLLVSKISNQVRDTIQNSIYDILKKRKTIFW
ncbi:MAG: acyltransferase family protein [Desulfatibacillum sp.]|nr:acyltransferase family protein [Desulfatibacillum sp.]